jgi:hypothetical protein
MATSVQAAVDELGAAIAAILPQFDGLNDLARLNLQPATVLSVKTALDYFGGRLTLLRAARASLQELLANGYPDVATFQVPAEVLAELRDDAQDIQAAVAKFKAAELAANLNLAASPPQPKK